MIPIPEVISIQIDTPPDFKVICKDTYFYFLISLEYKSVALYSFNEDPDGTKHFHFSNNRAIMEIKGGLAYYDYGWKIMPRSVQEKYVEYIAENELLGEK